MKFLSTNVKKITITCLLTFFTLSTTYASTVTSSQLADSYVGADGKRVTTTDFSPNNVNAYYDTNWMQVTRTTNNGLTSLNVTIDSNFVSYNNGSKYKFGDLFMMDADNYQYADACIDNAGNASRGCNEYSEKNESHGSANTKQSPNRWEYAFDLGGKRKKSYADNKLINGNLRKIDQNNYFGSIKSTTSNRDWQAIMVNDGAVSTVGNGGTWNTIISQNLLVMSFDITGTGLAKANQIALRWAMTCANDIIEVVTDFAKHNGPKGSKATVPEPSTMLLMFAGIIGLLSRRRFKK